ncbi:MAG TPA: NUDIX hydrolase [Candidatus Saccharimonadales bacterium]|nr:NUDIX hydrolase [Candidatus Saccharimonadales bacterium]
MKAWKRIEPTTVHKVGHRIIVSKTFEQPDGTIVPWDVVFPDGQQFVNVVALTPDNHVVVCETFRPGPEMVMQELPGGFVDEHEALEAAVRRELLEETGYVADTLEYLGVSHRDPYMNAAWHYFLGTSCTYQQARDTHEVEEQIDVKLITIDQLLANARNDRMCAVDGVLYAYDKLLKLKEKR